MEPTAARAAQTIPPAPLLTIPPSREPKRSASFPPPFSPTTIPRGFSTASATCLRPVRRSPTSPTFARQSLTDPPIETDFRANEPDHSLKENWRNAAGKPVRRPAAHRHGKRPCGGGLPPMQQHIKPRRRRRRLQGCRRLDHGRLVEPAGANLRNGAQRQSCRPFLLCLRNRLRSGRRMDGPSLYVYP